MSPECPGRCPRKWPRDVHANGPNVGHDGDLDLDVTWPQPGRALTVAVARQCPRADRDPGVDLTVNWPWPGNVRGPSATWPCPRISRTLTRDRSDCDRVLAAVIRSFGDTRNRDCPFIPPLIQHQSAKRSRNSRPAVRHGSRTWRRPETSLSNFGVNAPRTEKSPSGSLSTVCQRARPLSPRSVTRF